MAMLRMGASNASNHLIPLAEALDPDWITVIRPGSPAFPMSGYANVRQVDTSGGGRLIEVIRTLFVSLRTGLRERPDLLVSFNAVPYGIAAALVASVLRVPFHIGLVGSDLATLRSQPWLRHILDRAKLTTVPGKSFKRALREIGWRGRIAQLPHSIDTSRFRPDPLLDRTAHCVFVGRLIEIKGVEELVAAVAIGRGSGSPWRLKVLGEGPLEERLRAAVVDHQLTHLVSFLGHVVDPSPELRRARCIVLPSHREGLPFALIEGMACGAIPIVTPVGEITSVVRDGENGVVLASRDPECIDRAVRRVLSDPTYESYLRRNAIEDSKSFSYDSARTLWRRELLKMSLYL